MNKLNLCNEQLNNVAGYDELKHACGCNSILPDAQQTKWYLLRDSTGPGYYPPEYFRRYGIKDYIFNHGFDKGTTDVKFWCEYLQGVLHVYADYYPNDNNPLGLSWDCISALSGAKTVDPLFWSGPKSIGGSDIQVLKGPDHKIGSVMLALKVPTASALNEFGNVGLHFILNDTYLGDTLSPEQVAEFEAQRLTGYRGNLGIGNYKVWAKAPESFNIWCIMEQEPPF